MALIESRPRRRLAVAVAALLSVFAIGAVAIRRHAPAPAPAPATNPRVVGAFHLTDEQLRSIATEAVALLPFHSEQVTDGRIAFNGDTLAQVISPFSGRVTHLIAAPGALVKRGEPLFELDASEYAQGMTDWLSATAQQSLSATNEERRHAAYDARGGSLQDWQQAQNDLAIASANLAAVRNRLRILGLNDKAIDAIGTGGAKSAVIPVVAPIAGLVVDRQIGPGQVLQPGTSGAAYTIADLSTVWLLANVRETDAAQVRVGQTIVAHVLALPGREFKARLDFVGATIDPVSRRVPVRAAIKNVDGALKPEMLATFTIATSTDTEALAVPHDAVLYEGGSVHVWVMVSDHDAALRQVHVGRERDGKLEVLDGLIAGQRVITRGALFIDRAAQG
jgi:cobalt-zinc-cadmium efflux system membrane fusion protein